MTRILIAEPSYLLRKGLVHIIEQLHEVTKIEVVGSHLGLKEILNHFSPDIIIMNTSIAVALPIDVIEKHFSDPSKIIHLTNSPLSPNSSYQQISIYDSKSVLIEKLSHHIKPKAHDSKEEPEDLTSREKLILKYVALGHTNKEIAAKLFISTHTVISHRKNITRKLDIKSVSGLTVYAILNGIIKMDNNSQIII